MQLLDKQVEGKFITLVFAEKISEETFNKDSFSLRRVDSSYQIVSVNGKGGTLNVILNKPFVAPTSKFNLVYIPKSSGFVTDEDGVPIPMMSWEFVLAAKNISNIANGIGVPITCAENAIIKDDAILSQPLRVESAINYPSDHTLIITFNKLLDPSQIPDKSAFTLFAPSRPDEDHLPTDRRNIGTWQNRLSGEQLQQLITDLRNGAILQVSVDTNRVYLSHNYTNIQHAIIKYLPPSSQQLRTGEQPSRYITPFSVEIINDANGENCLPWYHQNRTPVLAEVSNTGQIDFATIDNYVTVYGLQETIQVSNDDNNAATTINTKRMNYELKAAAQFLINYIKISQWAGRALLIGEFNRTQLVITRYFLHNKRKPAAVVNEYEKIVQWIDQVSNLQVNRERINCEEDAPDVFADFGEQQYDVFTGLGLRGWLYDPSRYRSGANQFLNVTAPGNSTYQNNFYGYDEISNYQISDYHDIYDV